ncbi:hypothetical protein [Amycolatopsis solani]|uniref:hypothetical protein n=1 Tax=Amycolatopsis solani TaxID=3028615 RepID=UPI0025B232AF|nr:hypothetical protein [Amycolatopsis sp. MEP2-6]
MAGVVAVVLIVAVFAVVAAIWWRSHTKYVEGRKEHWFKAFAAERGGTFHSGVAGEPAPAPSFGVIHPTGRPLAGSGHKSWVEFRQRDRAVIAVDGQEPYRHFDDHTYFRDIHVTQVQVPPSPELRITGGAVSMPGSPLEGELTRWLAANPRFAQRDVVVEHGSARTWGQGCATRQNIAAEADYLADLADRLPAALWSVSGGAS